MLLDIVVPIMLEIATLLVVQAMLLVEQATLLVEQASIILVHTRELLLKIFQLNQGFSIFPLKRNTSNMTELKELKEFPMKERLLNMMK